MDDSRVKFWQTSGGIVAANQSIQI